MVTHSREEMREWQQEFEDKPQVEMTGRDLPLFLQGFLKVFGLRPEVFFRYHPKLDAWILEGADRWWNRPGVPMVAHADLARFDTTQVRYVLVSVFEAAYHQDELRHLTANTPRQVDMLLRRMRLD